LCAAGETAAAGLVSDSVMTLTEGALQAMGMSKWKLTAAVVLVLMAAAGSGLLVHHAPANRPAAPQAADATPVAEQARAQAGLPPLPSALTRVHDLVKPQANESLYAQVPWQPTLWEARLKAAAEGKPIFIWVTGGPPG